MAKDLLLLDDSPLIHRVVDLTFEGQDFAIHYADDADEALSIARTVRPAIVLASTELKGADGLDFCRRLRQEEDLSQIPLLLLTSTKEGIGEEEVRQAGASGVLIKPFEPERLLAEVERALAAGPPPTPSEAEEIGSVEEEAIPLEEGLKEDTFADEEGEKEEPAPLPEEAFGEEPEEMLQEAEALLEDLEAAETAAQAEETPVAEAAAEPAAQAEETPAAEAAAEPEVDLFSEEELEDLFGEELAEDIEAAEAEGPAGEEEPSAPAAEEEPPAPAAEPEASVFAEEEDFLAAFGEEEEVEPGGEAVFDEAAGATEFEEVTEALSEDQILAAEAELASLQAELANELKDAGESELAGELESARQEYETATRGATPAEEEAEVDLAALAEEAGFGSTPTDQAPRAAGPSQGLSGDADFEAELAAAGVTDAPPEEETGEDYAIEEADEADLPLPGDEGIPTREEAPEAAGLSPALEESLERSVEALVPTLMRHIESLVVQQLPDLVEKIVIREIEKIKRGE